MNAQEIINQIAEHEARRDRLTARVQAEIDPGRQASLDEWILAVDEEIEALTSRLLGEAQ